MSLFGSGTTNAAGKTVASGVTINSSCYGGVVPLAYGTIRASGNLIWYGDFAATKSGSSGKGKSGGGSYTYSAYFAFALCEGTIGGVANIWADGTIYSWAYCTANGIGLMTGASAQSPWGYLTAKHPGQDLGYSGTAYVYWQPGQFGSSAQLQNFAFEIQGIGNGVYGTPDADPEFVVSDMLTNAVYGVGFPAARLGDLSVFSNYCRASGLVISLLLDSQQDAASTLNDIVQQCNSEFVWSGGQLTIVPYGDQSLSANGATYTAPSVALYSLTDDDFLDTGSGDPVQLSRARPSDRMNSVKLEWLNRSNQYAAEIVEAKDQAAIETYGLRSDQPKQSHQFTTLSAATMSATLQLQRQAVRNQFTFTLGWKYCLLDPMDIVEITDANLGLAQQWVRILGIEEDDNGNLKVTAEEYLGGAGGAPLYSYQSGNPYIGNLNAPPGEVNAPVILEPPISLIYGDPQLMIGISGSSPYWGSADIYMSTDGGANYELVAHAPKGAGLGVTTVALPAGADPDTADLLTLDISRSYGAALPPASHGTADNFQSALWICNADYSNGELIGYGIETLTGVGTYKLSDSGGGSIYLRRGQLGTAAAAHAAGSMVLALDRNVFAMPLPSSLGGVTLYFKFVSYNLYGGAPTELATAVPYSFTPVAIGGGATGFGGAVGAPSGLSVTPAYAIQNDGSVLSGMDIAWTPTTDTNCTSQELQWSPHGAGVWTSIMVSAMSDYYFLQGLQANAAYDFRVRSVRVGVGTVATQYSAFITDSNVVAAFPAAPAALSAPTVAAGTTSLTVAWTASSNQNLAGYDVAYNTTNSLSGAVLVNPRPGPLNTSCVIPNLGPSLSSPGMAQTYYVFVRAIDTLGQIATWSSAGSAAIAAVEMPGNASGGEVFVSGPGAAGGVLQADGTLQPYLDIAWNASPDPLFDQYEVQWDTVHDGFATPMGDHVVPAAAASFQVIPVPGGIDPATGSNYVYEARVRTLRHTTSGVYISAWSTSGSVTIGGKTNGPGAPSGLTVSVVPGVSAYALQWTNPTDPDFDHMQIWTDASDVQYGALVADGIKGTIYIDNSPSVAAIAEINSLPSNVGYPQRLYYWLRPVNRSGIVGGYYPLAGSGATDSSHLVVGTTNATLNVNSATVLNTAQLTSSTSASPSMLMQITFTLASATNIEITAQINQSIASGKSWGLEIYDYSASTVRATSGNIFATDQTLSPVCTYTSPSPWAAGTYTVQLIWSTTGGTANNGFMAVAALMK